MIIERREDEEAFSYRSRLVLHINDPRLNRSLSRTAPCRIDPIRMVVAVAVADDPLQFAAVTRDAGDLARSAASVSMRGRDLSADGDRWP